MKKLRRLLTLLVVTALPIAALNCISCTSTSTSIQVESPFTITSDREAARLQAMALSVVEVQGSRLAVMTALGHAIKGIQHSVGTGWVVDISPGRSLVMTNEHVCSMGANDHDAAEVQPPPQLQPPLQPPQVKEPAVITYGPAVLHVKTLVGRIVSATVIFADPKADTCLISVDAVVGVPAEIAARQPPFGAFVERLGDDQGVYNYGLEIYSSGRWSGQTVAPGGRVMAVVSIAASHGASGSPIFYHGKVVAMVDAIPSEPLGTFVFAVSLDDINAALSKAWPEWTKK